MAGDGCQPRHGGLSSVVELKKDIPQRLDDGGAFGQQAGVGLAGVDGQALQVGAGRCTVSLERGQFELAARKLRQGFAELPIKSSAWSRPALTWARSQARFLSVYRARAAASLKGSGAPPRVMAQPRVLATR